MSWRPFLENNKPNDGEKVLAYWPKRTINDCAYESFQAIVTYWGDDGFFYPGEEGCSQPTHWDTCQPDPVVSIPTKFTEEHCQKHMFWSAVRSCPYCKEEKDRENLSKSIDLLRRLYFVIEKPHWKEGETEAQVTDAINSHLSNILGSNWREIDLVET